MKKQLVTAYVEEICIGLEKDGELIVVVSLGKFNRASAHVHVAIAPGQGLTRQFLWYMF